MALIAQDVNDKFETKHDITENLTSLQVECALRNEEKQLLYLKSRYHAVCLHQCAHVTFFVDLVRKIRLVLLLLPSYILCRYVLAQVIISRNN